MEALVNGLKLFYTDTGQRNAPVIVFLHGFPFDHTMWQEQAALCEASFRVISYDHRGHGKSAVGDGQYAFEFFVDDLFGLLDLLHIQKAVLCGLSMGGYAALRAVESRPERIVGLILCDTRSEGDSNEAKLKRAASVRTVKEKGVSTFAEGFLKAVFAPVSISEKPQIVDSIRQTINRSSPEGLCGTLIALATRTDTTSALPKISVPTLIIVGEADAITPPAASEAMQKLIPGAQLNVLPKAGHMSNLENPQLFNSHLLKFLKELS